MPSNSGPHAAERAHELASDKAAKGGTDAGKQPRIAVTGPIRALPGAVPKSHLLSSASSACDSHEPVV